MYKTFARHVNNAYDEGLLVTETARVSYSSTKVGSFQRSDILGRILDRDIRDIKTLGLRIKLKTCRIRPNRCLRRNHRKSCWASCWKYTVLQEISQRLRNEVGVYKRNAQAAKRCL